MPEPTQAHRRIAIETPLGADVLLVRRCVVREQINRPFQIDVDLTSKKNDINFDEIVGKNVTVKVEVAKGQTRFFNGYVARFVQTKSERSFSVYQATLVPWLWFLTRSADCRIFQETMEEPPDAMTVPGILKKVFKDHGFEEHFDDSGLSGSFRTREFCVQYRETAFNFVSRLMEHEGIAYFFEHANGSHKLVLANATAGHNPLPQFETIEYHPHVQGADDRPAITDWLAEREVQSGNYLLNDFNFENPRQALQHGLVAAAPISRAHDLSSFEIYDFPGDYPALADGEAIAQLRIEELQARHEVLRGQGTTPGLSAGYKFTLERHPRTDQNRECLVTSVTYEFDEGEFETGGGGGKSGRRFISCQFTAMPADQPFRPARVTPKPQIQGPQTAIVVGPSGEEIHTDKYARVKAQFHWDRYGKGDENASCWIRVSQGSAGKGWGSLTLPRVGHEVIVEFLDGDPDRPIITGQVYNADAMPPYTLPGDATKSTIKTNSSKGGGGFNELRFEDKKDSEQIFLHASKDLETRVTNDSKEWVGNEQHLIVKKDQFALVEGNSNSDIKGNQLVKIEGDHGITVKGSQLVKIETDHHLTVTGDFSTKVDGDINAKGAANINQEAGSKISIKAGSDSHTKAGSNYAIDAGSNVHIKGGAVVVIEGGSQLSLKVGGSFVDIGPSGISITGPMVKINSGGSAGSGSGASPTAPAAPEAPDPPAAAVAAVEGSPGEVGQTSATPAQLTPATPAAVVLTEAAQDGTPFCEECAKAAAEEDETVEEVATLTKIAWLDGADDKEAASPTQWVNIAREAKYVDATNNVANIDRMGRKVRFKVTFSKPGSHSFKVKAEPDGSNAAYTDTEKGRNANFKYLDTEKSYTTGSDGTKIVEADFFTTSAGGEKYKLVAEDTNNNPPVESGALTTKRLIYVVPIKMKEMTTAASLDTLKAEYEKHGITMVVLPAAEIDRIANIGPAEEDGYKDKCKTAFNGSQGKAKMPYAVAVGFTEHLAVKNASQVMELTGVQVGPGKAAAEIPVMARGLRDGDGMKARKLWKDLVPGEGWFVSASYTQDGGGAARTIAEASCTAMPAGSSCGTVKVDVTGLPNGTGTIKVTVHVVDRMRGGLSFPGGNLICICTKAWWTNSSSGKQNTTAIHEMGHKVGMVADGTGSLPDKVATFYDAKGHVGPHCYFDLGELDTYAGVAGNKCVMYGAVAEGSPSAFCDNCAPAVRKMDLGTGWTAS